MMRVASGIAIGRGMLLLSKPANRPAGISAPTSQPSTRAGARIASQSR